MRSTLATQLINCLRVQTINWNFSSQILCLAQSIRFCEEVEIAIEEGSKSLDNLKVSLTNTLRNLTSHDLSSEPLIQIKMKSLVFDLVHQIDIIDQLRSNNVTKVTDWFWKKQLRYYLQSNKAVVKMHDASFEYTYEYQGNAPRLVHTPLTDKCYLTLTQGMKMGFGGNPYGPGKLH